MANVLIVYYSDYGETMYDAISDTLLKNGNNVMRFNINTDFVYMSRWGGTSVLKNNDILSIIRDFNADVIFNFNNCLPTNCHDILKSNCRICAIDADAPEVAFWNTDMVEKHLNKYVFLGLQSYSKIMYTRHLKQEMTDKNYLYFPPATVVQNKKMPIDKNISFIGSNFYPLQVPKDDVFYSPAALKIYENFKTDYFTPLEETKKLCIGYNGDIKVLHDEIRAYYCGQERLKYMQQLTDLGFTFYGVRYWNHIAYYDFELAKCFDPTPRTTLAENEWVYNTSKISVNISHPLAKSSFSWRVMDIMASNSCLLTEDKPDWRDLFEKYLSPDVLDTIIYTDRFDMRAKAIRLLNDEKLRQRCIAECNNAIEKNGRWERRFESLENFLGIQFLNNNPEVPQYIWINSMFGKKHFCKKINLVRLWQKLALKKRFKIFVYSILLSVAQIPIVDLAVNSKKRKSLLKRIQRYWR